jgi:hypothetical protein
LWAVTESRPPEDPRDALIREQAALLEGRAARIAAAGAVRRDHGEASPTRAMATMASDRFTGLLMRL